MAAEPVSRRDQLLEAFMDDRLTPAEPVWLELRALLAADIADPSVPDSMRLMASLVSRLMDVRAAFRGGSR